MDFLAPVYSVASIFSDCLTWKSKKRGKIVKEISQFSLVEWSREKVLSQVLSNDFTYLAPLYGSEYEKYRTPVTDRSQILCFVEWAHFLQLSPHGIKQICRIGVCWAWSSHWIFDCSTHWFFEFLRHSLILISSSFVQSMDSESLSWTVFDDLSHVHAYFETIGGNSQPLQCAVGEQGGRHFE